MAHDSWKDSYDEWKLRSPYDDVGPEDDCCHEDYEADFNGMATCDRCGTTWWMTQEQFEAERAHSEAYDAYCRREERKARIEEWTNRLAFWRRWRKPVPINDDLPF